MDVDTEYVPTNLSEALDLEDMRAAGRDCNLCDAVPCENRSMEGFSHEFVGFDCRELVLAQIRLYRLRERIREGEIDEIDRRRRGILESDSYC